MTLSADSDFLFDEEVNNKWSKAYNLLGIDPSKLSNHSGTAQLKYNIITSQILTLTIARKTNMEHKR